MAVAYGDSTSGTTGAGGTGTAAVPSGTASGDLLVAIVSCDSTITTGFPAGWTLRNSYTTVAPNIYVYTKTAGSESGSYTFTSTATDASVVVHVYRFTGASTSTAPTITFNPGSSSTTHAAPSVTGTADGELLLGYSSQGGTTTWTTSAATEREDSNDGWLGLMTATTDITTSGATDIKNATANVARSYTAVSVAVPPATGGGGGGGGGPAAVRDTKWTQSLSSGAISVTKPTGTVSGDLLVAFQQSVQNGTLAQLTAPAGWTLIGSGYTITDSSGPFTMNGKTWWKIAGSSEGTSYSFSSGSTNGHTVAIVAFDPGPGSTWPTTPLVGDYNGANAVATAQTIPSLTGESGGFLYGMWSSMTFSNTSSYTPPSGMTEVFDTTPATFRISSMLAQQAITVDGATGTKTATSTRSSEFVSAAVAVSEPISAITTHTGSFSSTTTASAGIGTPTIQRNGVFSATAAATETISGSKTVSRAIAATAAATETIAPQVARSGVLSSTGVVTSSAMSGHAVPLAATAAGTAAISGIAAKPGFIVEIAATPVISGRKTVSQSVAATVLTTASIAPLLTIRPALTATAAATGVNLGFFIHQLKKTLTIDLGVSGVISPLPRRVSTVLVTTDLSGDPNSVSGMDALASIDVNTASTLTRGPSGRFSVNVDTTGRFSIITELVETVNAAEVFAVGNLRVVQSLTTIFEEGLPALLTRPAASTPEPVVESEPAPPVQPPVYNRVFLGLRR